MAHLSALEIVDSESITDLREELNLFSPPYTDIGVKSRVVEYVRPVTIINELGPYVFQVLAGPQYIDLNRMRISFTARILERANNNNIEAIGANNVNAVSVINMPGQSIFKSIDVKLNGSLVGGKDDAGLNHYTAYFKNLLMITPEVKQTELQLMGYYKDQPNHIDDVQNSGWVNR